MSSFQLEIRVKPRAGLLNPEGRAVHHALNALGWGEVSDVRVGKAIYVELEARSAVDAMETGEAMCRKILANPVTEDFEVASVVEMEQAGR